MMTKNKNLRIILAIVLALVFSLSLGLAIALPLTKNNSNDDLILGNGGNDVINTTSYSTIDYGSVVTPIDEVTAATAGYKKIIDAAGITAFLAGTDMYGYLSSDINFDTLLGSNAVLETGRTLDGNGKTVVLSMSNGISWADINSALNGKFGGLLVAINKGTIKNFNFVFDSNVEVTLQKDGYYGFGLIAGNNAKGATISNCSLNFNGSFRLHLDQGSEGASENSRTLSLGGFAGINNGNIDRVNANYNQDSLLNVQAKGWGNSSPWKKKYANARAVLGGIAGMQYGTGSNVSNVIVLGTGSLTSNIAHNNQLYRGTLKNHAGSIIGGNSGVTTGQNSTYGTKKNIVVGYDGAMTGYEYNSAKIGAFSSTPAENISNVVVLRDTKGALSNASDAPAIPYKTIYQSGEKDGNVIVSFDKVNANQLDIDFSVVDKDNDSIFKLTQDEITLVEFDNNSRTHSMNVDLENVDIKEIKVVFGNIYDIDYNYASQSDESAYTGKDIIPFKYTNNAKEVVDIAPELVSMTTTKDGVAVTDTKSLGSYKFEILESSANAGFILYDEGKGIAIKYKPLTADINVIKANIAMNVEDKWMQSYTADISVADMALNGIDKIEYSTDGGIRWNSVEGSTLSVDTNTISAGRTYVFRGYKNNELVTNEKKVVIKIDNTKPVISDSSSDGVESGAWTNKDINLAFNANDALSGISSVKVNGTDLEGADGKYSTVITTTGEYLIIVTDNAGNTVEMQYSAKIDKTLPNINEISALNSAGNYVADATSNSAITFSGTIEVGVSGGQLQYTIDDGINWVIVPVDGTGAFSVIFSNNTTGSDLKFQFTNGAGVVSNSNFGIFIIERTVIEVAITNDNISIDGEVSKVYNGKVDFNNTITLVGLSTDVIKNIKISAKFASANVGVNNTLEFTFVGTGDEQYNITNNIVDYKANIVPKEVVIAKQSFTRFYGDANPNIEIVMSELIVDDTIEYILDGVPSITDNVGKYPISIKYTANPNYSLIVNGGVEGGVVVADIEITQVEVNVDFSGYNRLVYTGEKHVVIAEYKDINGTNISAILDIKRIVGSVESGVTEIILPGEYLLTASLASGNYKIVGMNSITTVVAKAHVEITALDKETVYNGSSHNVEYSVNIDSISESMVVLYNNSEVVPTEAGTYTAEIYFSGNDLYVAAKTNANLNITAIDMSATLSDFEVVYDGDVHSMEVVGAPEVATVEYSLNNLIMAGKYSITAKISAVNYNDLTLTAKLIINKATYEGVTFENKEVTYDGNEHSLELVGLPADVVVSYLRNFKTNAGKYSVEAVVNSDNYNTLEMDATLTINHADIVGVTVADIDRGYDGMPAITMAEGVPDGAEVIYLNNGVIKAGYHRVTTIIKKDNYNKLEISSTIKIEPARVSVVFSGIEEITIGENLEIVGKIVDIEGNTLALRLVFNKDITLAEPGEYRVTAVFSNDNYELANQTVTFVIEKDLHLGAIIGGTLGGLALILIPIILAIYFNKRKNRLTL